MRFWGADIVRDELAGNTRPPERLAPPIECLLFIRALLARLDFLCIFNKCILNYN